MSDKPMTSEVSLKDLRGIAPDATGDLSLEEFMRRVRDGWMPPHQVAALKAENERLNAMIEVDDQERTLIIARAEKAEAENERLKAERDYWRVEHAHLKERYDGDLSGRVHPRGGSMNKGGPFDAIIDLLENHWLTESVAYGDSALARAYKQAMAVLEAAGKSDLSTLMRLCEDYKMPFSIGKIFYDAGFIDGHRAALPAPEPGKEPK